MASSLRISSENVSVSEANFLSSEEGSSSGIKKSPFSFLQTKKWDRNKILTGVAYTVCVVFLFSIVFALIAPAPSFFIIGVYTKISIIQNIGSFAFLLWAIPILIGGAFAFRRCGDISL